MLWPWPSRHDTGGLLDERAHDVGRKSGEWVTYDKAGNETRRKTYR